jgi:hypothetical protein
MSECECVLDGFAVMYEKTAYRDKVSTYKINSFYV